MPTLRHPRHSGPAQDSRSASRFGRAARTLVVSAVLAGQAVLFAPGAAQAAVCSPGTGSCGSVVVAPLSQQPPSAGPCDSPEPVVCRIRAQTPEQREQSREIRMMYHGLLVEMDREECAMRAAGASEEEIARRMVQLRNEAKEITRAGMSPDEVRALEERNIAKYGNPLGPTADQLYAKYGSWEAVTAASTRTSVPVDRELGLEYRECPCAVV
ncbi:MULTISPECIES: hypothetical protein [Streptomyces]|uniref:hypothetical protein n=1 Tax=Streptomyces TaxID=1883 RepID=UPI0005F85838|nr:MULTISPECIES: hypothetical protein [Streptomyces]